MLVNEGKWAVLSVSSGTGRQKFPCAHLPLLPACTLGGNQRKGRCLLPRCSSSTRNETNSDEPGLLCLVLSFLFWLPFDFRLLNCNNLCPAATRLFRVIPSSGGHRVPPFSPLSLAVHVRQLLLRPIPFFSVRGFIGRGWQSPDAAQTFWTTAFAAAYQIKRRTNKDTDSTFSWLRVARRQTFSSCPMLPAVIT